MFERPDQVDSPLYVVTSVFNAARFRSRWRLYADFVRMVEASGAILHTVEVAFGDRAYAVTDASNPRHLQLRTNSELWLKERALNLAVQRLPADFKHVAFVDADVAFARGDWANETVHQLQHYAVVQMFSRATDLSPTCEGMATHKGYMAAHVNGELDLAGKPYQQFHPGFAWAFRREAFNQLGGLLDMAILGAADRHMATALLSSVERSYPPGLSAGYIAKLAQWQRRAVAIRRNVGHVPGLLLHHWHGAKAARNYLGRWGILIRNAYDPERDLKCDWQGLWQLEDGDARQQRLRDEIRAYFRARDEDSTSV